MRLKSSFILLACALVLPLTAQDGFTMLTNGSDLSNWESYGGEAPYELTGDTITGTAITNTPNTFLCADKPYGDFILELEFFDQAPLNSGVMVRGQWREQDDIRRVYGYQVEIDPSPRGYTAGIYDEARRGWIYPVHYNDPARTAYRHGEWNSLRVEFIGDELRTFLNGESVANLIDSVDASGMICLQVHSVYMPDMAGKTVMWRNIRIRENATEADRMQAVLAPEENLLVNQLSEREKGQGWRLLFDGQSTDNWRGAKMDQFPQSGWEVVDGELRVLAGNGGESNNGGDIVTKEQFSDFELVFEFKPTEGANSGVKYFVDPDLNQGGGSAIGLEFQILDDERHPDAKAGVMGNRTMGSLYDLITANPVDVERRKDYSINDWNRGRIKVKDGKVEHWLNGYKVVEYDRFSQMFRALVNYSKYKDWENFGRWPQGPILLQDHGNAVAFRTIKIREL
ncbi:MAG: DUF1080 domain-containing protein [Lewinella sp.]